MTFGVITLTIISTILMIVGWFVVIMTYIGVIDPPVDLGFRSVDERSRKIATVVMYAYAAVLIAIGAWLAPWL